MRPSDIVQAIDLTFGARKPVMMWGPPGVGKSSVVRQIAERDNREVFDIRLALLDPTDLRGIPFYDPNDNTAKWATASILPQDPESNAILFLDEINAAPPTIQAAAYQLVLDRCIGEYKLPDGVDIVAAGNREGDKAVVFKMPTPLMNRFVHFEYDMNFDDWYNWAITQELDPNIIGFLKFKNDYLNKFDPKTVARAFPTPRTWEFASDILKNGERNSMAPAIIKEVLKGTIGDGAATEFWGYKEVAAKLPDPMEILRGNIKKMPKMDLSANFSILISLGQKLNMVYKNEKENSAEVGKLEFQEAGKNYLDFINNEFDAEFTVVGARDSIRTLKLPLMDLPNFKDFAKTHGDLIMDA